MCNRFVGLGMLFCAVQFVSGVVEQEPNDDFSQANPVACGDTVICATLEPTGDVDCFQFTGQKDDTLRTFTFSCEESNTNTFLCLLDSAEEILTCNINGGDSSFSLIEQVLPYDGSYYLRVVLQEPTVDSSYNLYVGCEPTTSAPHDSCDNARVVDGIPYQDASDTFGCTDDCGTGAPDVWYFFSNPAQRTLIFSVCMTDFQARVQIMGGCCTQFGDDSDEGCGDGAILTVPDMDIGDYYIIVEGIEVSEAGEFVFQVNGETEPCPSPTETMIMSIDGYPFLFWESVTPADFYVIRQSSNADGDFEHVGTTSETYWTDSTGFGSTTRFYQITAYCPW